MITPEQHQLMESAIDTTIEFLDKDMPDWKSKIDWDIFDFNDNDFCIAGQLAITDYRHRPEFGFYMPMSIIQTLDKSWHSNELTEAYKYMGNLWKQKAQPV